MWPGDAERRGENTISALLSSQWRSGWSPFGRRHASRAEHVALPDEFAGEEALERLNKITPPPIYGDTPTGEVPSANASQGPLTLAASLEERERVKREIDGLRMLRRQSEREMERQRQRQAAAQRDVERIEEHLEYHSREEIRSVYIHASKAEMVTLMVSEQLDQIQAKLQAFERYGSFLSSAIESFTSGGPTASLPPIGYMQPHAAPATAEPRLATWTPSALDEGPDVLDTPGDEPLTADEDLSPDAASDTSAFWDHPTTPLSAVRHQESPSDADAGLEDMTAAESIARYAVSVGADEMGTPEGWIGSASAPLLSNEWRQNEASEVTARDEEAVAAMATGTFEGTLAADVDVASVPKPWAHAVATSPDFDVDDGHQRSEAGHLDALSEPQSVPSTASAGWAPVVATEIEDASPRPRLSSSRASRHRAVKVRLVPVEVSPQGTTPGPEAHPEAAPEGGAALPRPHTPEPEALRAADRDSVEAERGVMVMGPHTASLTYNDGARGLAPAALNRIVMAQEEMAERLAQQIQGGPVQSLINLALEVSLYEQMAAASPATALDGLHHLRSLVNTIVQEHAQSLLALRPLGGGERSFSGAVRRYALMLAGQHQIPFEFLAPHGERPLRSEVATAAFRIIQEALLNAVTHSRASLVLLTVDFLPDRLTIEVEDDGVGFDSRSILARAVQQEAGGMMGMLERAEMLGGWLHVESSPGKGCLVKFSMPLEPAS